MHAILPKRSRQTQAARIPASVPPHHRDPQPGAVQCVRQRRRLLQRPEQDDQQGGLRAQRGLQRDSQRAEDRQHDSQGDKMQRNRVHQHLRALPDLAVRQGPLRGRAGPASRVEVRPGQRRPPPLLPAQSGRVPHEKPHHDRECAQHSPAAMGGQHLADSADHDGYEDTAPCLYGHRNASAQSSRRLKVQSFSSRNGNKQNKRGKNLGQEHPVNQIIRIKIKESKTKKLRLRFYYNHTITLTQSTRKE